MTKYLPLKPSTSGEDAKHTEDDCTGPVVLIASTHLSVNLPNALVQESVRAYYTGRYKELVTRLPKSSDGHISPPEGPGLGTELSPDLHLRPDARLVVSEPSHTREEAIQTRVLAGGRE